MCTLIPMLVDNSMSKIVREFITQFHQHAKRSMAPGKKLTNLIVYEYNDQTMHPHFLGLA